MDKPKCKNCGSTKMWRRGKFDKKFVPLPTIRYQCQNCGSYSRSTPRHARTAKILLLDIETLYMEVDGIWNLKTEYIAHDSITKDWSILCWGAKWLFEPTIMGQVVTPQEAMERREGSVLQKIWKLIDEADILVYQNGDEFDIPRLNTKFAKYGYPPPSPYLSVDTLKAARKALWLPSYKLDYVGKYVLGLNGKIKMEMDDWRACARGEKKALDKMFTYCKFDIAPLLEDWYLYLLPWVKSHPNLGLYNNFSGETCPRCESDQLTWGEKYRTPQGTWRGFRCNDCGTTGRGVGKNNKINSARVKG